MFIRSGRESELHPARGAMQCAAWNWLIHSASRAFLCLQNIAPLSGCGVLAARFFDVFCGLRNSLSAFPDRLLQAEVRRLVRDNLPM
jgi:hypothetical protein